MTGVYWTSRVVTFLNCPEYKFTEAQDKCKNHYTQKSVIFLHEYVTGAPIIADLIINIQGEELMQESCSPSCHLCPMC